MVLEADVDCSASNVPRILGITGSLTVLALLTVCLRSYVRIWMLKFFGPDDWSMIAAMLMAIATFVCEIGETHHGVGQHYECIPVPDQSMFLKWRYFHSIWITLGQSFVKISVAFFLLRLAPSKQWKWFLRGCIVFLTCVALACLGTLIFFCIPVAAAWDFELQATARCYTPHTYTAIGLFATSVNLVTDFLFALVPIPIIRMLNVNRRTKITLGFVLGLGLLACTAALVKVPYQIHYWGDADRLWRDDFVVWNTIELCLGILAASLPPLKPLFLTLLKGSRSGSTTVTDDTLPRYPPTVGSTPYRPRYNSKGAQEILDEVEIDDMQGSHSTEEHDSGLGSDLGSRNKPDQVAQVFDKELPSEDKIWQGNSIFYSDSEEQLHRTPELERTSYLND